MKNKLKLVPLLLIVTPALAIAGAQKSNVCAFASDQGAYVATLRDSGAIKEDLINKLPTKDPYFYAVMRSIIDDVFSIYKDQPPKRVSLNVYHDCMNRK